MNSLELYNTILSTFIQPNYDNNLRYCSVVVDSIIEEITIVPKSILNSPFVCEAVKLIKSGSNTISHIDAYTILIGVHKKLLDDCYLISEDASLQDKGYYLFKHTEVHNSEEKYLLQIKTLIHFLQNDVGESELDFSIDYHFEDGEVSKNVVNKESILPTQSLISAEAEERIRDQKTKVSQRLDSIQPLLSESLKEILGLKSDFNDLYTLMIGKKLISLYCSIYENYKYHKAQLRNFQDNNYKNLVNNSLSYLEEIEDCLDSLGIDIIISDPGSPFQGKFQETKQTNFDPRNSVILESIVPGFKYCDDIIVKERVKVQGESL